MKVHKTMDYNVLVTFVMQEVSSHFTPSISDMKKSIDTLLEKEFLRRQNGNQLSYVA